MTGVRISVGSLKLLEETKMVNKFRELNRRRKRRYESRKKARQAQLLNAKKETLRKLEAQDRLPAWVKAEKGI